MLAKTTSCLGQLELETRVRSPSVEPCSLHVLETLSEAVESDDRSLRTPLFVGRCRSRNHGRLLSRQKLVLRTIVVPQGIGDFRRNQMADVVAQQPHNEHAVSLQVHVDELGDVLVLALVLRGLEMVPDVRDLRGPEGEVPRPLDEAEDAQHDKQREPEPDEDEDLLIEQVDWEDALHDVLVSLCLVTNLKCSTKMMHCKCCEDDERRKHKNSRKENAAASKDGWIKTWKSHRVTLGNLCDLVQSSLLTNLLITCKP